MKFCMMGGLLEVVLRFEISSKSIKRLRYLPFLIDLAINLYKIVISQQIKEVITNGHEKLNKFMDSSNSVAVTCQKLIKSVIRVEVI